MLWGCFLEVIVALAGIGTAVTLFPVVKRQNEGMALGFVAARTLEAAMIFTGVASLLSLVTLRQDLGTAAGANAASLITTGASHIATYNWAFTLGQSLMPGINALLLGTLMYRSGLVPRVLPVIGLIGAPLHITAVVLTMFGVIDRVGSVALIAALPIAVWEFSLGVYLVVKGFKPPLFWAPTSHRMTRTRNFPQCENRKSPAAVAPGPRGVRIRLLGEGCTAVRVSGPPLRRASSPSARHAALYLTRRQERALLHGI